MLFCYYLLLAGGVSVVSGFTPVTYPAKIFSECSQYGHLQDELTTEALGQVQHCIDSKNILSGDSLLLPISSLRLLPDNCSQWLTSAGLL